MKRQFRFWTAKEIALLKKEVKACNGNAAAASQKLAPVLKRSANTISVKYYTLKKKSKPAKSTNQTGFSFEVTPKKVVMKEGYLQIYF